ncbi:hypothetical protein [Acetobacter syzygii]|uniref:hypothetical protein n=1 Tax=Acetobacter syzygii TaxID=146476 RepID=UPI00156F0D98|nr:hypothetical protein [Acetobacter syzygii]NSL92908.1 hypothetical protein [Acetobacter syzygii]
MADTSVGALIKSAYPAQYYATKGENALSTLMDIWDGKTITGQTVDLLSIPAVSSLVALSAAQWALASVPSVTGQFNVFLTGSAITYPDRYYCDKNSPCAVYDMWGFSSAATSPALADLYPITADAYADRQQNPRQQYYNTTTGALADYVPPVVVVPLAERAAAEISGWVQSQINYAAAMGEVFSDAMKTYVKAISAIANGTDTTSTTLPDRPTVIMS